MDSQLKIVCDLLSWGYCIFDFGVGGHDGVYKGQVHVIVPFIGRKNGTLTARRQLYNDVHGWYRAHTEHLFGPRGAASLNLDTPPPPFLIAESVYGGDIQSIDTDHCPPPPLPSNPPQTFRTRLSPN